MRYSNGLIISTAALALMFSGCVKPTDQVTTTGTTTTTDGTVVYENGTGGTYQPTTVYEDGTPIVYEDPATTSGTYTTDGTEISTGGYSTTTTGAYDTAGGAYGTPTTTTSTGTYTDPYASTGSSGTYTPTTVTYTDDTPYVGGSTAAVGGGIQLQVAALKNYASAEEFKNSLSLDPKYSAYVQQGSMNRVIVTGFSSRSEALALRDRQFPGGFIVSGSAPATTSSTYNTGYAGSVGSTSSGVGVQVGAFSTQSAAQAAAESASMGRYTPVVKQATVGGRTIYKAILLGFSSRSDARNAIATGQFGSAFVTTYP